MLKALELIGFKSFADRTRFEFPRGITVVVGPNGSGKSNVVDAIKWVLGEQSVKSLRGKEMIDVIFAGSSARSALNSAETTLTFDNADRRLAIDTPEVHITRRVYRSGEGEYFINRQPCRLRDIRDLFAGTGVATEAYSIIEQGKVDVMLQSSAKDRRAIFEEASGISRFKAKKVEALRRLERVDQNLLRLHDIVDEVESRLKSVRAQAAKARRYKDYADRLQELRTQVGLADWRALGEKLAAVENEAAGLRQLVAVESAAAEAAEQHIITLEAQAAELESALQAAQARLSGNQQRTAAMETTIEHERTRVLDLEDQAARHRKQLHALTNRAGDLAELWQATQAEVQAAEVKHREVGNHLGDQQRALTALTAQLDQIRAENEQRRATHLEQLRTSAALTSEISTLENRLARTEEARQRSNLRLTELQTARERLEQDLAALNQRQQELIERREERAAHLAAAREDLAEGRRQHASRQKELAGWREKHSGLTHRAALLEELEKRHEGVDIGPQQVLQYARENPDGPFQQVRGLLADVVQVSIELAPAIEAALGEKAQHIVISPGRRLLDYLIAHGKRLSGRVGFLPLDAAGPPQLNLDLSEQLGVIGRADRFVQSALELAPLVRRLLGNIWIVENLSHAVALGESVGRGLSYVTLSGEFLAADGTLVVGQKAASAGLISRRSELRALRAQIAETENKIADIARVVTAMEQQVAVQDQAVAGAVAAHQAASEALAEQKLRITTAAQRRDQLTEQHTALQAEFASAAEQEVAANRSLTIARERLDKLQADLAQTEARMSDNVRRIEELDASRQLRNRDCLSAQVELARSEQQLDHLRVQLRRYEQDRQDRERTVAEASEHLADCETRRQQSENNILTAEAELAELFLHREALTAEVASHTAQREQFRLDRAAHAQEAQRRRSAIRKLEEQLHAQDLAAGEIRHERTTLESRLREDYGIELAELSHQPTPEEQHQREQVEAEIADLRRKLTNIGGVNLDSLSEVDEMEARYLSLAAQHEDLSKAKGALEQIIHRINADSRRLFAETLETVKGHFQQLFRKLFGGGQADIILDEGVDILESGIEIVARPPGKEPRNISLLSGGEKTLTCVALLLAIFRSRPSPFCVLDEVDAALDEANIERFVNVLREFLQWTQFVVVSHSKKTMAFANTLYGVTMQESGVSKRVSVRFDDVSETGEISQAALQRANRDAPAASPTAAQSPPDSATEAA
ncbi:MAG TPA: chromosome segregation protein SMC [Pirellulales bacterium]|jgi:chromosome segregation protein|nr:chromosome segregation protein SMC [Pirellulales bacterium]